MFLLPNYPFKMGLEGLMLLKHFKQTLEGL